MVVDVESLVGLNVVTTTVRRLSLHHMSSLEITSVSIYQEIFGPLGSVPESFIYRNY